MIKRIFGKLYLIYLLAFLFILTTKSNSQIANDDFLSYLKKDTININPSNELKIYMAFENWKINEINKGVLIQKCPKYGTEEWELFLEKGFDQDNRWGLGNHIQLLYADFNNDDVVDGLFVLQLDDCAVGGGYVGDPEKSVLILSRKNHYVPDDEILNDFYFQINKQANNDKVAYISINYVRGNAFYGTFKDWKKDGSDGSIPSIKKYFGYDFKNKKLYVSSNNRIDILD